MDMAKSKSKEHRISKQDTNKLLTAIDQVTIPIPDLFAEEHLTKDEKASLDRSIGTTCDMCDEYFLFHRTQPNQLDPSICPTCEENMFRVERGDQDAMDYYKEFYCSLCGQNHYYDPSAKLIIAGSDAKPHKAPTIDDVIPDGFMCLPCYQYCYDNLVLNKANVKVKKSITDPNVRITPSGIFVIMPMDRRSARPQPPVSLNSMYHFLQALQDYSDGG